MVSPVLSSLQFCLPVKIFGLTSLLLRVQNIGIFFSLLLVIMTLLSLLSLKLLHWCYVRSMILRLNILLNVHISKTSNTLFMINKVHKLVVLRNFFIHKNFLSCFCLFMFYFEKFSTRTDVCRIIYHQDSSRQ